MEARKNVLGEDGTPTALPNLVEEAFPLNRPNWDYNTAEGRGHLLVYRWTLVAGLREFQAAWLLPQTHILLLSSCSCLCVSIPALFSYT